MRAAEVIAALNQESEAPWRLLGRSVLGEQGAYSVVNARGHRAILKFQPTTARWEHWRYAQHVTQQLRLSGYPAPAYLAVGQIMGGIYALQSVLPGTPAEHLTPAHLGQLFHLLDQHAGTAPPAPQPWPEEVVQTVLVGGQGYCLHTALLQHSQESRALLATLQSLVQTYSDAIPVAHDIVHFDFQSANFLLDQGRISGVVDWEGVQAGDRAFDLATLLFYCYENASLRRTVWDYALARSSGPVLGVYLAHLILRQVDWSLRRHSAEVYERFFARSQAIVRDLATHLP